MNMLRLRRYLKTGVSMEPANACKGSDNCKPAFVLIPLPAVVFALMVTKSRKQDADPSGSSSNFGRRSMGAHSDSSCSRVEGEDSPVRLRGDPLAGDWMAPPVVALMQTAFYTRIQ